MATNICSSSPRISFSHGIPSDPPRADASLLLESSPSDFNFTINLQISAVPSSNADELFSNGKILPFFKPQNANPPPQTPDRKIPDSSPRTFWPFGRSVSVGSAPNPGPTLPLNRCKSTGSFPNLKLRSESGKRRTYYFSGSRRGGLKEGGVRINPILNVPAPGFIAGGGGGGGGGSNGAIGGIFAYLLCNCGGEAKRDEMHDFLDGSRGIV